MFTAQVFKSMPDHFLSLYMKELTHFNSMFHFYTPRKRQKTKSFQDISFLTLPGGIEIEHWAKVNYLKL